MTTPGRAIYLGDVPLDDRVVSKPACQLTVDLTDLPQAVREQLARTMVNAADDFIHGLGIYPMPHLEYSLAGVEVPCPRRFHINERPANSGETITVNRTPTRPPAASLRVINPGDVVTVYVDNVLGDDARGNGTLGNPFRTRAAVLAMADSRTGVIIMRRPDGGLLGTVGDLPPDQPPRAPSPVRVVNGTPPNRPRG